MLNAQARFLLLLETFIAVSLEMIRRILCDLLLPQLTTRYAKNNHVPGNNTPCDRLHSALSLPKV